MKDCIIIPSDVKISSDKKKKSKLPRYYRNRKGAVAEIINALHKDSPKSK